MATVGGLLLPRCPPAVIRPVSTGIVDPFERQLWRRFAQVGDEVVVAVRARPALANRYPTTAVVGISWVFRVSAPANHRGPFAV